MKIALVGYGKMGRTIFELIKNSRDTVVAIIDPYSNDKAVTGIGLDRNTIKDADVFIDFSSASNIIENIKFYATNHTPAVIGTTGWLERVDEAKAILEVEPGAKAIYSGNFSLGVAIFNYIVRKASHIFNHTKGVYDVAIMETHHREKADSPSGTALMVANTILSEMDQKSEILVGNSEGKIRSEQLQIISERVGKVPGIHEVVFDGPADTISITHTARNRDGFAYGALRAATWITRTRKTGLLTMDDLLKEVL